MSSKYQYNNGNSPSGCFTVGSLGLCGPDCWVYQNGDCGEPQAMVDRLEGDELIAHSELYSSDTSSAGESDDE